jgi:hypothetical protein
LVVGSPTKNVEFLAVRAGSEEDALAMPEISGEVGELGLFSGIYLLHGLGKGIPFFLRELSETLF